MKLKKCPRDWKLRQTKPIKVLISGEPIPDTTNMLWKLIAGWSKRIFTFSSPISEHLLTKPFKCLNISVYLCVFLWDHDIWLYFTSHEIDFVNPPHTIDDHRSSGDDRQ